MPPIQPLTAAYLDLRPSLVRFFAAKLRSAAAAEDLVQELYLRAARQEETGATVEDAKAWLFRAGSNLLIDTHRSMTRAAARDRASLPATDLSGPQIAPEPSAEAVVDSRQRLGRLLAVVDAMPPRMREAFRLHKIDGLSQAQTAQRMGVSVKAVEKHLASALERLVSAMPEERR